jgi:hypothetical protein
MVERFAESALVALVTYDGLTTITADDQLLVDALAQRGVRAVSAVWSDPSVIWSDYSAVVVRSCWDYFLRADEFYAWLARIERSGARVFNSVDTLRWNAEKTYLRELESRGVTVVPTHWLDRGESTSLRDIRRATGWSDLVVKPAISGSAHDTWRSSPGTEEQDDARLRAMTSVGRVMVQPLIDVVAENGEWSLLFFDGTYSHAVLKRPRSGDFRVQLEHGGSVESVEPPASVIAQANDVLRAAPSRHGEAPLYARVDGCVVDGHLMLMELELIEPVLFFGAWPGAADRLADALVLRLARDTVHERVTM